MSESPEGFGDDVRIVPSFQPTQDADGLPTFFKWQQELVDANNKFRQRQEAEDANGIGYVCASTQAAARISTKI